MIKRRGRPALNPVVISEDFKNKWEITSYEFESEKVRDQGFKIVYNFDKNINPNGLSKTEITYPKTYKAPRVKNEKSKAYNGAPVVMVFKTSNRSNSKTKMKVWNHENIDYIMSAPTLPGVPEDAIILELGVGHALIEKYASKYFIQYV
jgi:hypothetical protein